MKDSCRSRVKPPGIRRPASEITGSAFWTIERHDGSALSLCGFLFGQKNTKTRSATIPATLDGERNANPAKIRLDYGSNLAATGLPLGRRGWGN